MGSLFLRGVLGCAVTLNLLLSVTWSMPVEQYSEARKQLMQEDRRGALGQGLVLSADEKLVSDHIVKLKEKLIEDSRIGREVYYPALSFYQAKPLIDKSPIFSIIKKMPKGAALHLHDMAIASIDWLVKNVTYRSNLFMCVSTKTYLMTFKFSKTLPKPDAECTWNSVKEARKSAGSVDKFDESIKKNISLLATDVFETYPSLTKVWNRFQAYFGQVFGMIFYEPVFRDYFRQALKEFDADNVQYFEMRGVFNGVYDLDGNVHGPEYILKIYQTVLLDYLKENPGFFGAKFIITSLRVQSKKDVGTLVNKSIELHQRYPNSMVGYDLVGQEDPNYTLQHYKEELLVPSQQSKELPFFFHAAETNWQGTATDYNLIDAILLNTSRIGHGYGLIKHPKLVSLVKQKGIAVEANPISNQILHLVKDLRNHALIPLMLDTFPIVISSDDPIVWEADPLSHDFFMAFMNMCGEDADLRFLKQLAINSIKFSAMQKAEKANAMKRWKVKWDKFIKESAASLSIQSIKNAGK